MEKAFFMPIRDIVVFPGMVTQIYVGRSKSVSTIDLAVAKDSKIVLAAQRDPDKEDAIKREDIYNVGVLAHIVQVIKLPNNNLKVLVSGEERVKIGPIRETENYTTAEYDETSCYTTDQLEVEAVYRKALSYFEQYATATGRIGGEVVETLKGDIHINTAFDIMAANLPCKSSYKQTLLETFNIKSRGEKILGFLAAEMDIASLEKKIEEKVRHNMNDAQKAYYIKEKINVLKEELGDLSQDDDMLDLMDKLKESDIPKEVKDKIEAEMKRLAKMPAFSAESTVSRTYIETLLELPWNIEEESEVDLKKSATILDRDHYGLKDVKEKVLDYLAVKKLNPEMKGNILCFVGPPGTGKTSIVKSIAESMGRKFVRVSLGGVRDEAEIRGHRRTYIGSMPGRIIKAIKDSGTRNPVMLFDELDKMSADYKGDPASAMLEVLDPEQNHAFEDHYIDMPFDLSKVFFVATANDLYNIPKPLRDRMDIVNVTSYTEFEKMHIAKRFLLPKAIKNNGLAKVSVNVSDKVILRIINEYTSEAGVRTLERRLIELCRKIARKVLEDNIKKLTVKVTDIETYLGKPKYKPEKQKKKEGKIGNVVGMAYTSVGGVTLDVQCVTMPAKTPGLKLTGTLGDVMKESASVAFTYVRANDKKYKPKSKDFYDKNAMHLHFPEGATPKDGPSAGITITTAIVSAVCSRKVRQDVAMTGEVTITGEVLPIGGVKEKVIGAHRAGIREVILPDDNRADIVDIPEEVAKEMKINFAKTYDDVEKIVFMNK